MSAKARIPLDVLESVFGDFSDGAYFAAMEEHGYDATDLLDAEEAPPHRVCRKCAQSFGTKRARNQHERDKHRMHNARPAAAEATP